MEKKLFHNSQHTIIVKRTHISHTIYNKRMNYGQYINSVFITTRLTHPYSVFIEQLYRSHAIELKLKSGHDLS